MDLFESTRRELAPLSERMRCTKIEEFIGQEHLVKAGSLLNRAIVADRLGSCIFYGPTGTGKTTLANIIANTTRSAYVYLNAVSCGVADAKKVIDDAKNRLALYGQKTYLLLDECHRWSKSQSDCVLGAIEKGEIIFVGSTTENPFVSMTKAIVSRCRIFEFKKLTKEDVSKGIDRAIHDKQKGLGNYNISISNEAVEHLAWASGGDMRQALNALELAVLTTTPTNTGEIIIDLGIAEESCQRPHMSLDPSLYYDILSAFCKSLRGSDPDAALYYSSRLIDAGIDPLLIARRLIVHASEDVGMADTNALNTAVNALYALERIGLPEAHIPLAHAIIYVCLAPKSNSVVTALMASKESAKLVDDKIPRYLCDTNFKTEKIVGYKYPHDYGGYVDQQYLPDSLANDRFYFPSENGQEKNIIIPKLKKGD